jgi:nitrogen-specific signal transduction histidine kinase
MAEETLFSDCYRVFETVRIPFVLTDDELLLIYANQCAREALPIRLERGKKVELENLLQSEDSAAIERMVSECLSRGESSRTLKQRGTEKYFKVKAYNLNDTRGEIVFHFEDVSQSRILENQLYEHLVDLYSKLETQEREITDLRAILMRSQGE